MRILVPVVLPAAVCATRAQPQTDRQDVPQRTRGAHHNVGGFVILTPVWADSPHVQPQSLVFRPRSGDKAIVLGEAVLIVVRGPRPLHRAREHRGRGTAAGRVSRVIEIVR